MLRVWPSPKNTACLLENYLPTQIVKAAKKAIRNQDYLPSIATLVRAWKKV